MSTSKKNVENSLRREALPVSRVAYCGLTCPIASSIRDHEVDMLPLETTHRKLLGTLQGFVDSFPCDVTMS